MQSAIKNLITPSLRKRQESFNGGIEMGWMFQDTHVICVLKKFEEYREG
jgi:hypothetical protein